MMRTRAYRCNLPSLILYRSKAGVVRVGTQTSAAASIRNLGYKNLWGGGNNQAEEVQCEHSLKPNYEVSADSWRLDWEEDGRWVEWRLDKEAQSEFDQHRVQMEWRRFREDRGRDWTRLWEDKNERTSGFNRGSANWWREQHYDQEFVGSNGVKSMSAVRDALDILEVSDAGDASAVRAAYLRLVNRWHPDRFQDEEERKRAAATFRSVTEAYNLLKEYRDR